MRRTKPAFCLAFLTFCFCFFAHPFQAAGSTSVRYSIDQPTTWTKENSPYLVGGQVIVKAPLTIEAGTVVKFVPGSNSGLNIQNDFFVNGTEDEKVIFTSLRDDSYGGDTDKDKGDNRPVIGDWMSLKFGPTQDHEMKIEGAVVSYSNFGVSAYAPNGQKKNISVKNSELKHNGVGIYASNSELLIENNTISENSGYAISLDTSAKISKAENNSILGNGSGVRADNSANPKLTALDAKNNWWGDRSGPRRDDNPGGQGDSATGAILFDPWLKEDPVHLGDPVIIIPGILGSWKKDGEWELDPILHTYDNLYAEFEGAGYVPKEDLFTFPYEWRDSNKVNAVALRGKIEQIKNKTHKPKVDIVAHSMGGLLAREYIESSYYNNDVDQLITVGTPNLGAPKDYLTWEAGEFDGPWAYLFKSIFKFEAEKNGYYGYSSVYDYIHGRPIESAKELLPVYNYLYDTENNSTLRESYPTDYPRNEFLENLNDPQNIKALKSIEFTKVIGKMNNNEGTISGFNVIDSNDNKVWANGCPKWFGTPILDNDGVRTSDGDKTVPLVSAESVSIPANRTLAFQSEHNALPTDAQKDILEILTGKTPSKEVRKTQIPNILLILVHSPVDIQIESPSGEKVGKNFKNGSEFDQIPGAFYSGYDTDQEFITIPNPEEGEYKILTEGTGSGEYTIETTKISEDENNPEGAAESTASVTGTAEPKVQEQHKIEIDGNSVKKVEPLMFSSEKPNKKEKINAEIPQIELADTKAKNDKDDVSAQPSESQIKVDKVNNLRNSIREYYATKQIRKRSERNYFLSWLGNVRVHLKRRQLLEEAFKTSQKSYKNNQKDVIKHCKHLIAHIGKNSPKYIGQAAAEELLANLNDLKKF
jgi:hypothetical protein